MAGEFDNKAWVGDEVYKRLELVKAVDRIAVAMDIDGACYARAARHKIHIYRSKNTGTDP
ncbi:MAG: hypothetical protein V8S96_06810 [Lachnospiraceae bacterium]